MTVPALYRVHSLSRAYRDRVEESRRMGRDHGPLPGGAEKG